MGKIALKRWVAPKENKSLAEVVAKECDTSLLVASILVNRGKSSSNDAMQFLSTDIEIASPYAIKDMQVAVDRIHEAIDGGEKIAVYGDYDCDGITSTAILYSYLRSVGAEVVFYIPERDCDGYGLNLNSIDKLSGDGVGLIITVDNGISAIDEIEYATGKGVDVIVTDHHQPRDVLPPALAIVNPHRRDDKTTFKEFCGAGVVCKLLIALEEDLSAVMESYGDLVAIGTIGDIVPLVDENRALVKYGLDMLKVTDNIGLNALMKVCGVNVENITAQNVAFTLVPRINAAGRMGSALTALELLLCEDEGQAMELATKLDDYNKARQASEASIMQTIDQMLLDDKTLLTQRVLILSHDDFNHGVLGIVCSRLVERYGKPVMLMTADGNSYKGSARSIGEFHLFKALNANDKLLQQFGGHKLAAGFSLEKTKLAKFRVAMEDYAMRNHDVMPVSTIVVDKQVTPDELTLENIEQLDRLKPFGCQNEEPRFLLRDATIEGVTPISQGKHIRLALKAYGVSFQALYFGVTNDDFPYKQGDKVDLIITADINLYNGKRSVSVKVKDLRLSHFNAIQSKFFSGNAYYEKIVKGEPVSKDIISRSIPTKAEIALAHKWLINNDGFKGNVDSLFIKLIDANINYCKLRIIIDILCEFNLLTLSTPFGGIIVNSYKPKTPNEKLDLNQASLLRRLEVTI